MRRLERIDISGLIEQGPGQIGNVNIEVKAYGPKQHKLYKTLLVEIAYTQPGNLFYRGTLAVNDPAFSFSCIVPKDTESDIAEPWQNQQESKIIFYAEGDGLEASGVADGFFIGDIDPNAPVDTSGPEYTLSFDGKKFEAGDVIRREPELTLELSDPSGINIVGTRGHTIKLLLDRTESYDLTDSYSCENGFTSGKLTYRLPQLSVGKHAIEISADDSYNNVSKISLDAEVAGSETGDIAIQNLLNYPNPMATQGTTFTFNLTDFAQKAVIRIYSQAGRLVDTLKFTAGYGYNQVFWKPPLELANGVYFYKLSVTSANGRSSSKIEKLVVMR
jgi:hypothetical protein